MGWDLLSKLRGTGIKYHTKTSASLLRLLQFEPVQQKENKLGSSLQMLIGIKIPRIPVQRKKKKAKAKQTIKTKNELYPHYCSN